VWPSRRAHEAGIDHHLTKAVEVRLLQMLFASVVVHEIG
jgi:hypothetical protein